MQKHGLKIIGQYWQSFEKDFTLHKKSYLCHLDHLATANPLKIDAQTGKDYFTFEENQSLFVAAKAWSERTGIPVAHETHRNKALFAAHVAKNFFDRMPDLKITADLSHWCNVAESFLEDQQEVLAMVPHHAIHIHARVGHPQSPQVIDPRLPAWNEALRIHTQWWKSIIDHHRSIGTKSFTITPEFGPAPYTILHPQTNEPLADQWEINKWMMNYLKEEIKDDR